MKHTVVMSSPIPSIAREILSQRYEVVEHSASGTRSEETMALMAVEADGLITLNHDPVTRRVLESNPNLRIVANYAVGVDNIDLSAASELGIVVTNTPGVLTEATADLTMALLLAAARRVPEGDRMVRSGEFHGWDPFMLLGASLQRKRLGIIGMGRIGTAVARRARSFGMEITYHSRSAHEEAERELGALRLDFDELISTSDFVSLHLPLKAETRHMIDRSALERMKPGAYLINASRGPLVDESALADALTAGTIRGAALDVYEREPAVEPRLLPLDNVILLPHLGSATEEARTEMARIVATEVTAVLEGGRPRFQVN
ncbi:MAG TPA: D-glycerate dehydrogenase [Thermoanaerobaculia bacterium]|nr:D-glycerate dehydrogenase [Thermoanaerobaculia bacterium]